jgi:hypothetical protein
LVRDTISFVLGFFEPGDLSQWLRSLFALAIQPYGLPFEQALLPHLAGFPMRTDHLTRTHGQDPHRSQPGSTT